MAAGGCECGHASEAQRRRVRAGMLPLKVDILYVQFSFVSHDQNRLLVEPTRVIVLKRRSRWEIERLLSSPWRARLPSFPDKYLNDGCSTQSALLLSMFSTNTDRTYKPSPFITFGRLLARFGVQSEGKEQLQH